MDEIHVHKTKKSICAHFAESPCINLSSDHVRRITLYPFFLNNGNRVISQALSKQRNRATATMEGHGQLVTDTNYVTASTLMR